MHRARRGSGRLVHGTGPDERPVHLDGAGVELEVAHAAHRRARAGAPRRPAGRRGAVADDVGEHGAGGVRLPVTGAYAGHAAVADVDGRHLGVGAPAPPPREVQRATRASASCPAPPWGTGKPDRLAEHRHQHAEDPEPGEARGKSAWPALPSSSSWAAGPAKSCAAEGGDRRRQRPHGRRGRRPGPAPAPAGRPRAPAGRASQPVDERGADAVPGARTARARRRRRPRGARRGRRPCRGGRGAGPPTARRRSGWPSTAGACSQRQPVLLQPQRPVIAREAAASG